jgi:hypothetical protein
VARAGSKLAKLPAIRLLLTVAAQTWLLAFQLGHQAQGRLEVVRASRGR